MTTGHIIYVDPIHISCKHNSGFICYIISTQGPDRLMTLHSIGFGIKVYEI